MSATTSEHWAECENRELSTDGSQPLIGLLMVTASSAVTLTSLGWFIRIIGRVFIH